jgi:hypothetical protein
MGQMVLKSNLQRHPELFRGADHERFGLKDMNQLKRSHGPRWACHLQDQILGERLVECFLKERQPRGVAIT